MHKPLNERDSSPISIKATYPPEAKKEAETHRREPQSPLESVAGNNQGNLPNHTSLSTDALSAITLVTCLDFEAADVMDWPTRDTLSNIGRKM